MTKHILSFQKLPLPLVANCQDRLPPRYIGALEETSLLALLDYLAEARQAEIDPVTRQFCERFSIAALKELPAAAFDEAVKYLVDQIPSASLPGLQLR